MWFNFQKLRVMKSGETPLFDPFWRNQVQRTFLDRMEDKMIQPESRLDFEPIGAALAAVHPSLRNYQEKHAPGEFLTRQKS